MIRSPEFEALLDLSADVGSNPNLVQGPGGNTSIKEMGTLWIKASGLWLRDAHKGNMMVPVALDPLLDALERDDPSTEKAQDFVLQDMNPSGLRPSIETTVHALMPQKIVVHVHCVETIAHAVLAQARSVFAAKLKGFAYAYVPYARPGLPLAKAIAREMREGVNVLVLGNHGLAVAGDTVAETAQLLDDVCAALKLNPRSSGPADKVALERLALGSSYHLPADETLHDIATDLANCQIAAGGTLYPDHVVFLGKGSIIAAPHETAATIEQALQDKMAMPAPMILFPGRGVLVRRDANAGALALARCLRDVAARIPEGAALRYLTDAENAELSNWDAEKYRQELTRKQAGPLQ